MANGEVIGSIKGHDVMESSDRVMTGCRAAR